MNASQNAYKRYFKQWNWTKNRTRELPTPITEAPDGMGGRLLTCLSGFIVHPADNGSDQILQRL